MSCRMTKGLANSCQGLFCRLQQWSVDLAPEHRNLVAQQDDLDGQVRVTATDELDQLKGAAECAVEEGEGHRRMLTAYGSWRQNPAHGPGFGILGTDTRGPALHDKRMRTTSGHRSSSMTNSTQ